MCGFLSSASLEGSCRVTIVMYVCVLEVVCDGQALCNRDMFLNLSVSVSLCTSHVRLM